MRTYKTILPLSLTGLIALTSSASFGNQCIGLYTSSLGTGPSVGSVLKLTTEQSKEKKEVVSKPLTAGEKHQRKLDDQYYMNHFFRAVETEFTTQLTDSYKEILKKIIFKPETLTDEERDLLIDGKAEVNDIDHPNYAASSLKYYLDFNHITEKRQEQQAEAYFRASRKNPKLELEKMDLVALRFSRVIGRDFHLLNGTQYEKPESDIKEMKWRFLSLFAFGGKMLTRDEFNDLYDQKVIVDDSFSESRFELAQWWDDKFVDKNDIKRANENLQAEAHKWRNPFRRKIFESDMQDPINKTIYADLNKMITDDPNLRRALKSMRLEIFKEQGKNHSFEKMDDFADWIATRKNTMEEISNRLKADDADKKLEFLIDGISFKTSFEKQKSNLNLKIKNALTDAKKGSPEYKSLQELKNLIESPEAKELFSLARDIMKTDESVTVGELKNAVDRQLEDIDTLISLQRAHPEHFKMVFKYKQIRTELNEAEAQEIFNLMTYSSDLRLLSLLKFDPTSKYGFCFGRAFFGYLLAQKHGVHRESLKKVFVYGPMSGGLFGWGFHVAFMIAKEGGGFWVLDPSHDKVEDLDKWMTKYQRVSKDGRIRMYIAPGDRFGRVGFGTPDWNNLNSNYGSIWNRVLGSDKLQFFRDNLKAFIQSNFDKEKKNFLREGFDGTLEFFKIGL